MNVRAPSAAESREGGATSQRFIDLVLVSRPADLPEAVLAAAKTFLADTLAVGVAGTASEGAKRLAAAFAGGTGPCRVLGRPDLRLPAYDAALLNGFQIHCLEWDGLHEPSVVIALCATTAALLAECDARGPDNPVSGLALLHALVVGVEAAVFFGAGSTTAPRFFRPSAAGTMGAAMALGRLRGFSRAQMLDLLGLAYSQVGGTMQAHWEGSEALPLQVGFAARAALTAADLVQAGMTGPHDVIDGKFGYFTLIETATSLDAVFARWAAPWKMTELAHKPFPAGRATQSVLTALLEMRRARAFTMADIASLTVYVPPLIMLLVGRPYRPDMGPGYARLCMEYVAPEMVEQGRVDPRRFTPRHFGRPEAADFAAKVALVLDGNPDANALSPQRVELRFEDGTVQAMHIAAPLGSPDNPLDEAAQREKAQFAFAVGGFAGDADRLFDAVAQIDKMDDVRSLLRLVTE